MPGMAPMAAAMMGIRAGRMPPRIGLRRQRRRPPRRGTAHNPPRILGLRSRTGTRNRYVSIVWLQPRMRIKTGRGEQRK